MEQTQIQGNHQQERWLYWLGGIIDGEGTITISWNCRSNQRIYFVPKILIANTDKKIIEKCQELLEEQKLAYWIRLDPATKSRKKPIWRIEIKGYKRVARALTVLSKYLVGKKERAEILKNFVDIRLKQYNDWFDKNKNRGSNGRYKPANSHYTQKEIDLIAKLIQLNNQNPQRLYAEVRKCKFAE